MNARTFTVIVAISSLSAVLSLSAPARAGDQQVPCCTGGACESVPSVGWCEEIGGTANGCTIGTPCSDSSTEACCLSIATGPGGESCFDVPAGSCPGAGGGPGSSCDNHICGIQILTEACCGSLTPPTGASLPNIAVIGEECNDVPLGICSQFGGTGGGFGTSCATFQCVAAPQTTLITGIVWRDDNRDGVYDQNEPGIDQVGLTLTYDDNGTNVDEADVTDGGDFDFSLGLGVAFVLAVDDNNTDVGGALEGLIPSPDGFDSVMSPQTGVTDENTTLYFFGFMPTIANLTGCVWHDLDADGTFTEGTEPGIADVLVGVTWDDNGTLVTQYDVTDENGSYSFEGLTPDMPYALFIDDNATAPVCDDNATDEIPTFNIAVLRRNALEGFEPSPEVEGGDSRVGVVVVTPGAEETVETKFGFIGGCAPNTPDGSSCNDGCDCSVGDTCIEGACSGAAKDCTTFDDQCNVGVCNEDMQGMCEAAPANEEDSCEDGDLCTTGDLCVEGTCSATPVDCSDFDDQCNVGECDGETGDCFANTSELAGEGCSDDDNCTIGDTCSGGACLGVDVDCSDLDDQCLMGTCQPDGSCASSSANEGGACTDDDACTDGDVCNKGACLAGPPVVCPDPNADACEASLDCDSSTGSCVPTFVDDLTACNDGDNCTVEDLCLLGECAGAPVVCQAQDACHGAGECNGDTGLCSNPELPGDESIAIAMLDLGTLGGDTSRGFDLNDHGMVVGVSQDENGTLHAFGFAGQGMVSLAPPDATESRATGINDSGMVAGVAVFAEGASAFVVPPQGAPMVLWDVDNGDGSGSVLGPNAAGQVAGMSTAGGRAFQSLPGVLTITGPSSAAATAVDAIGEGGHVLARYAGASGDVAFVWPFNGAAIDVGTIGGATSALVDVNASGDAVGVSTNAADAQRAVLWTGATGLVDLGVLCDDSDPPACGDESAAVAVNDGGMITGWSTTTQGATHAFVRLGSGGALIDLGTLGGANSVPVGVSEMGVVTGTAMTSWGAMHAFVWDTANGMRDLGTLGGDSARPVAIGHGWVAGVSSTLSGAQHGFLWSAERGLDDLGSLAGGLGHSNVLALNALGQTTGVSPLGNGNDHAFLTSIPETECVFCPVDNSGPAVTCPVVSGPVECQGATTSVLLGPVAASDACGGDVTVTSDAPVDGYARGTTTVIYTATDARNNVSSCASQVTVQDTQPPVIACPGTLTVASDEDTCGAVVDVTQTALDRCDGEDVRLISSAPDVFPVGTTNVTLTALDGAGNEATCAYDVTVVDTSELRVDCPVELTVAAPPDTCVYREPLRATVRSACIPEIQAVVRDSSYPVGTSDVLFEASSSDGRQADCTTALTVEDVTDPVPSCNIAANLSDLALPFSFTATAFDACGVDVAVSSPTCAVLQDGGGEQAATCAIELNATGDGVTVNGIAEGTTVVRWTVTATDPSGNAAARECQAFVTYTEPDGDFDGIPDTFDNCPEIPNTLQFDLDEDGVGDACDQVVDGLEITGGAGCQGGGTSGLLWFAGLVLLAIATRRRRESVIRR